MNQLILYIFFVFVVYSLFKSLYALGVTFCVGIKKARQYKIISFKRPVIHIFIDIVVVFLQSFVCTTLIDIQFTALVVFCILIFAAADSWLIVKN